QAFARLGTSVHVVSRDSRILAHDDADHALALQIALEREGVRFTFGTEVLDARIAGEERVVRLTDGCELRADAILAAVGRTPRVTGFGLEDCGVEVADGAIRVDDRCRTTVPRIYAAGDVTGPPFFTHAGEEMSKVAVANALLHIPRRYDRKRIPWCTFTAPELAHAGLTEATLRSRGIRHQILSFPNDELDRAVVDGETTGSTKLFVDRRGRVLGASILSSRAGEAAAEIALAIAAKLSVTRIADVVHAYPSYGYGPRRAADGWYTQKITPCVLRLLRTIFGFRGNAR
ncbi:MAG: FAD-dependent oxidoreductase, partial [Vulcanimicrobiaceae bacterium]